MVDNNSTDQSAAIARSFDFVTLIHEKRQGKVYARNAGFNAATGDIIGRIDGDVIIPPGWVAYVKRFYQDPAHRTHGLTGGGQPNNLRLPRSNGWALGQVAFRMNRVLLGHYILFGSNMALPRSIWLQVQDTVCEREDIHEDLDLAIHVHQGGYKIAYREGLRVTGQARRLLTDREGLLPVLLLWPHTLRVHHKRAWIFGWLGAYMLYGISPIEIVFDKIARLFGKPPLPQ